MKKIYLFLILPFAITTIFAQIPAGYYDSATGTGATLKTQLYNIISPHTTLSYPLWSSYYKTDVDIYYENDGTVLDIYSENPAGTDAYEYILGDNQCGNVNSNEGYCYNNEHSFPKSWFNDASPMYSDLFHIYPTDGQVNSRRSNYPYGEVSNPTWTSQNGSKLGPCSYPGYTGTVFEPIDEFKGDLARTYFYMATCYENEIASWETNTDNSDAVLNGTSYPCFESWTLNMLLEWNAQDPVSQKEINRNDSAYKIQGNRNPYIDHPEWVECVWNNNCAGSVNPPSNLIATGVSVSEIDLSWILNTNNDNILLAYNTTNTFGTPSGTYTAGNTISGGGEVLYTGNNTSFVHTGLSPQTYYYKIWSVNTSEEYSNGTELSASPLYPEPENNVTNLAVSNETSNTITLTWTDAVDGQLPDAYLIKAATGGSVTAPVDGTPEADASFVKNVTYGIQTVTFMGLNASTTYYFEVFPYTNSGSNIDYKTDSPASAVGQTTVAPAVIIDEDFTTCPATGWLIYSVSGDKDWECGTNSDMYVNAFDGSAVSDDWFISPSLNLDNYSNEVLTFTTYTRYSDGGITNPEVRLKYSTDYTGTGDPNAATWTEILYTFPSEDSQTWTSSGNIDLSGISGTSVYLAFVYTSSGTGAGSSSQWELDDIYLQGTPLPTTDANTDILPPTSQISSANISSLSDTDIEAVQVFSFTIEDKGSGDNIGTDVYNFRFYPAPNNTADWTDNIQGVKLSNGTNTPLISQNIEDNYINIQTNPITVADASSEIFTLSIYLNTRNITDNAVLSFMIDADNHNFISDNQTSRFATTVNGGTDIISGDFTIEVNAENIIFAQQPTDTEINLAVSPAVTIQAVDENGNIDTDYSDALSLTSSGNMTGAPLSGTWNAGTASFDNIIHTETGTDLQLNAVSGTYSALSDLFSIYCMPEEVSNINVSCGSESSNLTWENPTSCFDRLILVVNDAGITGTPSGNYTVNSSDFTDPANPDFPEGGKVLYSGTGSSETVTGLTNNTQYYFKIFVNGSGRWSNGIEANCTPLSVKGLSDKLILYPNPAKDILSIKNTVLKGLYTVELLDITGKSILKTESQNTLCQISLTGFKQGLYIIEIKNNEQVIRKRIIIE